MGRVKFGEEESSKPNFTPSVQHVAPVGKKLKIAPRVTEIPAYMRFAHLPVTNSYVLKLCGLCVHVLGALWRYRMYTSIRSTMYP